jgi:extradiol dioxygenase family protein
VSPVIFRVIVSVDDIERASDYYGRLFGSEGRRISPGWHYFDAGTVIVACHDPATDEDDTPHCPNPEPIYFAVPDVDKFYAHCAEHQLAGRHAKVATQSSGERSLYMQDPFGNPLCFVEATTCFTGDLRIGGMQLT